MKDSLWSVDLFRCESTLLNSHWAMVVMDQFTRRIIGFGVHAGVVDGPAVCRMFNEATARSRVLPRYLSSDNDPLFEFHRWKANLRVFELTEVKTVPYFPLSHPFIESLVGTVRREFLDCVPFWSAHDLRQKLSNFQQYYNHVRVRRSLDGATPDVLAAATKHRLVRLDDYRWKSHCGGLYQLPAAA